MFLTLCRCSVTIGNNGLRIGTGLLLICLNWPGHRTNLKSDEHSFVVIELKKKDSFNTFLHANGWDWSQENVHSYKFDSVRVGLLPISPIEGFGDRDFCGSSDLPTLACQKTFADRTTSSFAIKKSRFDFADELKVGDVRYKHLTQITIKVQLFWRLSYGIELS